jgi:hypothetical protein
MKFQSSEVGFEDLLRVCAGICSLVKIHKTFLVPSTFRRKIWRCPLERRRRGNLGAA